MANSRRTTHDAGSPATAKCVRHVRATGDPHLRQLTHSCANVQFPFFSRGSSLSPSAAEAVPDARADIDVYVLPVPDACVRQSEIDASLSIEHWVRLCRKRLWPAGVETPQGRPARRQIGQEFRQGRGIRSRESVARVARVHARNSRSRYFVQTQKIPARLETTQRRVRLRRDTKCAEVHTASVSRLCRCVRNKSRLRCRGGRPLNSLVDDVPRDAPRDVPVEVYGGHTMEPGETRALRWPFQPLTAWGGASGGSVTAHA